MLDKFAGNATLTVQSTSTSYTATGQQTTLTIPYGAFGAQWFVECLVGLEFDYGKNQGWVQLFAPSPNPSSLAQPRCLLAGAAEGASNALLAITSSLTGGSCKKTGSQQNLTGTTHRLIDATNYAVRNSEVKSLERRCRDIFPPPPSSLAPFNFRGAFSFTNGNPVTVLVGNSSIVAPFQTTLLSPTRDDYALATCVKEVVTLPDGSEVKLFNAANECMFLKASTSEGVLRVLGWTNSASTCASSSFKDAKNANANVAAFRASGVFPLAPPPPAGSTPPPPRAAMTVQSLPVTKFTQVLSMPLGSGTNDDLAIKLMSPCAAASIRASYAASLGVPISSVVLERFSFSDGTPAVNLSPTDAGNQASGACTGSRRLEAESGARALQAPSPVTTSTILVNPPASATTALTTLTPQINVAGGVGLATADAAPTGITSATLSLPQPKPAIVRITPYVPSDLIMETHNLPRGKGATNDFNLDGVGNMDSMMKCAQSLGDPASCPNTYVFGAIAPGVSLIVAGVVFLIVWFLSYCIACCTTCQCCRAKRCPARDRSAGGRFEKCAKWVPIVRAVLGVITCGLVLGGLGSVQKFPGGLTAVTNLVQSFGSTASSLVDLLTGTTATEQALVLLNGTTLQLAPPLGAVNTAAQQFSALNGEFSTPGYEACASPPTGTCTQPIIKTLVGELSSALTLAASGSGSITGASSSITTMKSSITSALGAISLGGIENQITMYTSAALGVIAAIVVFQAVLVCRNFFACCMFKCLAPVSIILNFIIFLLAGIFYIIGVVGADCCFRPNQLIMSAISVPELNYFLSCAIDTTVPTPSALDAVSGVISTVAGGISQLSALKTQVDAAVQFGNTNPSVSDAYAGYGPLITGSGSARQTNSVFTSAAASLNKALGSLQAIPDEVLSCAQVDGMLSRLWDGMCNGTVTSAIGIARVLIAAGVFMLIQMAIGIDVCCYRACNINKQKPLFPTRASPLSTLHPTHRPGRPPRVEGRRSQGLRGGGIQ